MSQRKPNIEEVAKLVEAALENKELKQKLSPAYCNVLAKIVKSGADSKIIDLAKLLVKLKNEGLDSTDLVQRIAVEVIFPYLAAEKMMARDQRLVKARELGESASSMPKLSKRQEARLLSTEKPRLTEAKRRSIPTL